AVSGLLRGGAASAGAGLRGDGMSRSAPATPASLSRLETLVSPLVGVVSSVDSVLAAPDDARAVKLVARTAATGPTLGVDSRHLDAGSGGCAESPGVARAAAIGEAVERY